MHMGIYNYYIKNKDKEAWRVLKFAQSNTNRKGEWKACMQKLVWPECKLGMANFLISTSQAQWHPGI